MVVRSVSIRFRSRSSHWSCARGTLDSRRRVLRTTRQSHRGPYHDRILDYRIRCLLFSVCIQETTNDLTNRWSQPLAVVMTTFDFMKQFQMFATLAAASGGSAPSR